MNGQQLSTLILLCAMNTLAGTAKTPSNIFPELSFVKKETCNNNVEDNQQQRFTLSGYVKDSNGEPLINATVYDLITRQGTMTNAYGYFSLTLVEGQHELRCSYVGYKTLVEKVVLTNNRNHDFVLQGDTQLDEVTITTDLNSPLLKTQTGKLSLSQSDIKTEFSLMSSPDVIKTLQRTSGVAEGMELSSGLYVHGGNSDENLFLIDGTPLYHTQSQPRSLLFLQC